MLSSTVRKGLLQQFTNSFRRSSIRYKSSLPFNTCILFVPQQEAWIIERFGKFERILEPGLNIAIPIVDTIRYVQSLKEIAIDIPEQSAITADNVTLNIDGVLYLRIVDAYKASYGVEDAQYAITQLAQTTMRSEIGKISLDHLFRERESLNIAIVEQINLASIDWGVQCKRYEILDINMPPRVQEAMQMQVEAERKKRATVLESEGIKAAEINVAEGKKQSRILASEADKLEQINKALGEAEAMKEIATARALAIEAIANSMNKNNAHNAISFSIAEQYISAFSKLAKESNTILLPSQTGDVNSMIAQAMTIYKQQITANPKKNTNQFELKSQCNETDK